MAGRDFRSVVVVVIKLSRETFARRCPARRGYTDGRSNRQLKRFLSSCRRGMVVALRLCGWLELRLGSCGLNSAWAVDREGRRESLALRCVAFGCSVESILLRPSKIRHLSCGNTFRGIYTHKLQLVVTSSMTNTRNGTNFCSNQKRVFSLRSPCVACAALTFPDRGAKVV